MRRKKSPAELRTVGLFTGKTVLEEAEELAKEEAPEERTHGPRDLVAEAEECAVRWLGQDGPAQGDDVKVAVHAKGHAVLVLVRANGHGPYGTTTLKLSKAQWDKLRQLAREAGPGLAPATRKKVSAADAVRAENA